MPFDPTMLSGLTDNFPGFTNIIEDTKGFARDYANRKYSEKLYARQKADSLEFWNMQNKYNSPAEAMKRFQEAGLNPNLIYGNSGNNSAAQIPTPDTEPSFLREPRVDKSVNLMSNLLGQADLRIKQAQANNLDTQNEVLKQEIALKALNYKRGSLNLDLETELYSTNADARRAALRKTQVETDVLIDRNIREAVTNSQSVAESAERILNLQEQRKSMPFDRQRTIVDTQRLRTEIANLQRTGELQKMDINLRKLGVNPNDPMWARYVGKFMQDLSDGTVTASTLSDSIWNWLFK